MATYRPTSAPPPRRAARLPWPTTDDLDRRGGLAHGTTWLGECTASHFSWLEFLFGRQSALRMTYSGEECLATRISHHHSPWTEYDVPVHREDTLGEDGNG